MSGAAVPQPPRGISVLRAAQGTAVRYRWLEARHVFAAVVLAVWLGGLVVTWLMMRHNLLNALIIGLNLLLPVGPAYYVFACLVNSTWVEVARGAVRVRHGPLPWLGGRRMALAEVSGFESVRMAEPQRTTTRYTFDVSARLRDGGTVVLLRRMPIPALADWLVAHLSAELAAFREPGAEEER